MPVFTKSTLINAPVAAVFGFHERADALSLLTPSFPPVTVISRSGGIQSGSLVQLRVGPFPWVAMHTDYEENRLFTDEQITGPFTSWVHRHEFDEVNGKTRLTDRVAYQIPGGWLMNKLLGWIIKLALRQTFRYRHRVTRRFCEAV